MLYSTCEISIDNSIIRISILSHYKIEMDPLGGPNVEHQGLWGLYVCCYPLTARILWVILAASEIIDITPVPTHFLFLNITFRAL